MKKNEKMNKWLWKWHVIAGLISLPFVLILAVTGGIYLFKDNYEVQDQQWARKVEPREQRLSYDQQLTIAQGQTDKPISKMVIPRKGNEATQFIGGMFASKSTCYINPYTGKVIGNIAEKDTDMFTVRKLHGELLMGGFGTKIVELIACWLIVLILTGIYVWWPQGRFGIMGTLRVRTTLGKRTFFRDLHGVTAFWFSILLFMILLGGLPWTDVFGGGFKWVQEQTGTGFPPSWQAQGVHSQENGQRTLNLDAMVKKADILNLPGEVNITIPQDETDVFSVSNNTGDPKLMQMHHFDQYSGKELVSNDWNDIGILMQGRLFFMAFHQGQFGPLNKWLMLMVAIALAVLTSSALVSYLLRAKKGWGIPKVPKSFTVGIGVVITIGIMAIVLPLFGLSLIFILFLGFLKHRVV